MEKQQAVGYLYTAAGQKYIDEAIVSASSLKRINPSAHITIVSDRDVLNDAFDNVVIRASSDQISDEASYGMSWKYGLTFKVRYMYSESPYEKTLFVDTDTYFYEDCSGIFDLLEYFDISMAHSPSERSKTYINGKCLTGYFPYNTGIILFKKNSKNEFLFKKWIDLYDRKIQESKLISNSESDQTSFMEALLVSDSRIYVLPNVWNARLPYFANFNEPVKIVHGRHDDYEKLKSDLNSPQGHRCWHPQLEKCLYRQKNVRYYLDRLPSFLQKLGVWSLS